MRPEPSHHVTMSAIPTHMVAVSCSGGVGLVTLTPTLELLMISFGFLHALFPVTDSRHLRVTSILVEPYLMLAPGDVNQTGNARYTGYMADLLEALSAGAGFQYRLQVVRDGRYGNQRTGGTWDGMIGELLNSEADLAASPLYITHQRQQVVQFSEPFLSVSATLLLSHYHHYPGIQSARDLLNQDQVHYGTLGTGVILNAFRHTNNTVYKIMWDTMKASKPSIFTRSNIEGLDRVRAGNFAFILPSTIGQYISKQTHCDLYTLDSFLMSRSFALAVSRQSGMDYLIERINRRIRLLRRKGKLDELYRKWWEDQSGCGTTKRSSVVVGDPEKRVSSGTVISSSAVITRQVAALSLVYSVMGCLVAS